PSIAFTPTATPTGAPSAGNVVTVGSGFVVAALAAALVM
nr:hypothetical protein [Tanacetum cinerariifolium]